MVSPHTSQNPGSLVPAIYLGKSRTFNDPRVKPIIAEYPVILSDKSLMDIIKLRGVSLEHTFLKDFPYIPNLRALDMGIRVFINLNNGHRDRPSSSTHVTVKLERGTATFVDYQQSVDLLRREQQANRDYLTLLMSTMLSFTRLFHKYIPSVRKVYFWELRRNASKDINKEWNRWCCNIMPNEDGLVSIGLDPIIVATNGQWTRNMEGTGAEEEDAYESDATDS